MPKARLDRLVGTLKKFYGVLAPPPSEAFTLFVWEILSNHSTPGKRDAALAGLNRHGALTPEGMWRGSPKVLAQSVHRAGPYGDQRMMGLRKGVDVFRRKTDLPEAIKGPLPAARRWLKQLPKMTGDSGMNRMLLFAGGHAVLPVNARVARAATRLGFGERSDDFARTAKSIRRAVAPELADSVAAYRDVYVYLEHHGAATCLETDPHCDECPLLKDCPYGTAC